MGKRAGISLGLYSLAGARLNAVHFTQEQVEEANEPSYWAQKTGVERDQTNGWLAFLRPDADSLRQVWMRSPAGEVLQAASMGSHAEIRAVGRDVEVI